MKIPRPALLVISAAISAGAYAEPPTRMPPAPRKTETIATPVPIPEQLVAGSQVTPDAFNSLDWIQGKPFGKWEPGAIYVIQLWRSSDDLSDKVHSNVSFLENYRILFLNNLHKKYSTKGVHVVGVSVCDDELSVVKEYLKGKGDAISYPIAYAAKDSAFEKEWLNAMGMHLVKMRPWALPMTIVVKDGKILLFTNADYLSEGVAEAFLAGGEKQAATLRRFSASNWIRHLPRIAVLENQSQRVLPGVKIPPEDLTEFNRLNGDAPLRWEPGVVYLINFWANWSDLGLSGLPRANELHKQYSDKGLRVLGVCQFGDITPADRTVEKLKSFAKAHEQEMSYPVVQSPENSHFDRRIKAAGLRRRSNHMLLIKDGEILLSDYPKNIPNELIESVLAGGEKQAAALRELAEAERPKIECERFVRAVPGLIRKGDLDGAEKLLARINTVIPKSNDPNDAPHTLARDLAIARVEAAIAEKDWEKIRPLFESVPYFGFPHYREHIVEKIVASPDAPESLLSFILDDLTPYAEDRGNPEDIYQMMRILWRLGDKEGAFTAARLMGLRCQEYGIVKEPFAKIAALMEHGVMPDEKSLAEWFHEAKLRAEGKKR